MDCVDCAFGNVCVSSTRDECICFNSSEMKCMKEDLSVTAQEILKSSVLKQYVFTLKRSYERYLEFADQTINLFERQYYLGMADSVLAFLNDLGFGHLVWL